MDGLHSTALDEATADAARYEPPTFELISLDCEITSYAPDGDEPLF